MTKMLKFVHLTDLHLSNPHERPDGYDTHATSQRALEHAAGMFPDMDFAVITGDIANWGEPAAYDRMAALLEHFPHPTYLMVGNHDNRANFLARFGDRHPYSLPYIQYVDDRDGLRLMFLDSQTPGTHGGAFNAERLDWIAARLAETTSDVLMFMHHHPTAIGAPSMDAKGLANWPAFHEVLRPHASRIRHIFHGHCHTPLAGSVLGIPFSGLRSMGPQAFTDLRIEQACRWVAQPHYGVVLVGPESIVTHQIEFAYTGPYMVRDRQKFTDFMALCRARGVEVPTEDPAPIPEVAR